jgi:hypothetical protein
MFGFKMRAHFSLMAVFWQSDWRDWAAAEFQQHSEGLIAYKITATPCRRLSGNLSANCEIDRFSAFSHGSAAGLGRVKPRVSFGK